MHQDHGKECEQAGSEADRPYLQARADADSRYAAGCNGGRRNTLIGVFRQAVQSSTRFAASNSGETLSWHLVMAETAPGELILFAFFAGSGLPFRACVAFCC